MKPEQNVIGILFEKYQKQGYVTQDNILNLCEEYDLSFIQTDYVGSQLLEKGVLISDVPVNVSDNSKKIKEAEPDEEQELTDYAQVNYDEIYRYFLLNYPEMKTVIEYAKAVPPMQKGEFRRLLTQARSGNKFARDLIIKKYIRYALKSVLYYKDKTTIPLSDIFSEAMISVVKAVNAYNPYENSYFSSYVSAAIRQNVERYICNFERIIRIPIHMMEKINVVNDLKTSCPDLEPEELIALTAEKLKISIQEANKIYQMAEPEQHISLEELKEDENSENPAYAPVYLQDSVEELAERAVLKEDIAKAMQTLSEKEQQILSLRYGLNDGKIVTLEELGQLLDITRERVRQIESKALRKLQHPSRRKYIAQYSDSEQKNKAEKVLTATKKHIKPIESETLKKPQQLQPLNPVPKAVTVSDENHQKVAEIKTTENFEPAETAIMEHLKSVKLENFIETKKFIIKNLIESAVNMKIQGSELFDAMDKYDLDILQYAEIYDSIAMQGYALVSDEEYRQEKGA